MVDVYGLPVDRLWFTVYTDDDEAAALWEEVGAPPERILRFGEKDNFWSMGETGPCGPCSEIHFDRGPDPFAPGRAELVNGEGDGIIEIWNLVFMQFDRDAEGKLHPLPSPCVDTGAGPRAFCGRSSGRRNQLRDRPVSCRSSTPWPSWRNGRTTRQTTSRPPSG